VVEGDFGVVGDGAEADALVHAVGGGVGEVGVEQDLGSTGGKGPTGGGGSGGGGEAALAVLGRGVDGTDARSAGVGDLGAGRADGETVDVPDDVAGAEGQLAADAGGGVGEGHGVVGVGLFGEGDVVLGQEVEIGLGCQTRTTFYLRHNEIGQTVEAKVEHGAHEPGSGGGPRGCEGVGDVARPHDGVELGVRDEKVLGEQGDIVRSDAAESQRPRRCPKGGTEQGTGGVVQGDEHGRCGVGLRSVGQGMDDAEGSGVLGRLGLVQIPGHGPERGDVVVEPGLLHGRHCASEPGRAASGFWSRHRKSPPGLQCRPGGLSNSGGVGGRPPTRKQRNAPVRVIREQGRLKV